MVKALKCGVMVAIILEALMMDRKRVKESTSGPMEVSIQVTGQRTR